MHDPVKVAVVVVVVVVEVSGPVLFCCGPVIVPISLCPPPIGEERDCQKDVFPPFRSRVYRPHVVDDASLLSSLLLLFSSSPSAFFSQSTFASPSSCGSSSLPPRVVHKRLSPLSFVCLFVRIADSE